MWFKSPLPKKMCTQKNTFSAADLAKMLGEAPAVENFKLKYNFGEHHFLEKDYTGFYTAQSGFSKVIR